MEEEYLLVDLATRDLVSDPPAELAATLHRRDRWARQPRIPALAARGEDLGVRLGVQPCAASSRRCAARCARSRPTTASRPSPRRRIRSRGRCIARRTPTTSATPTIAREVQGGARRMVICGMHVHVGLEDDELRIDVMNQLSYFVPHLLALSCSSPFWEGDDMGMQSFRLMLLSSLPRTGLPERFESYGEFRRHLDALVRNGLIEDTTKIWWDIRPSSRYPTLETRVFDCCTHLDDAVCLAALNLSLVRMLYRLRRENKMLAPLSAHADRGEPLARHALWQRRQPARPGARRAGAVQRSCSRNCWRITHDDAVRARLPRRNRARPRAAQARHQRAPAGRRLSNRARRRAPPTARHCRPWSGWLVRKTCEAGRLRW